MKLSTPLTLLLAALSPRLISANTPLTDAFVTADLANNHGFELAFASRPMWHFAQSLSNKPCYPSPCFSPTTGQQHGLNPSPWPNAGEGCPDPGAPGGEGRPFPTYYTVTRCGEGEIRVVYSLYFQKDGWSNVLIAKGHMHDWERIIVTWRVDRTSTPPVWRRFSLHRSMHSGYDLEPWASIQNTITHSTPAEQGGRDKDGAKIYVGWGKHAMFSTRNTGWNDPASQGCQREFRGRDWWFLPTREGGEAGGLVWAGKGGEVGGRIAAVGWGGATSDPVRVEEGVCAVGEGGYVACRLAEGEGEEGGEE